MSLFVSASGILAAAEQQRISANNIANMRTPGFRATQAHPQSRNDGGVVIDSYTRSDAGAPIEMTQRPLDVATPTGFFQVQRADGSLAYTQDGSFGLNADGEVVTQQGDRLYPPVAAPEGATSVTVSETGKIYATTAEEIEPRLIGQMEVFIFPNMSGLESLGGNLYQATAQSGEAQQMEFPLIESGALNASNVDPTQEMLTQLSSSHMARANMKAFNVQENVMGELLDISE